MNKINYLLVGVLVFILSSCGKDDDEKDLAGPEITIESPIFDSQIKRGENLNVVLNLEDDNSIKDYKINIDFNSDLKSLKVVEEFKFDSSVDKDAEGNDLPVLSGNSQENISFSITTKENFKKGIYELKVTATDEFENTSEKTIKFTIQE